MNHPIRFTAIALALLGLAACSSESDGNEAGGEHVWKGQTEAIDKAREVETILKRKQQQQENQ